MKKLKNMSQVELAAYIQAALQKERIDVVLSGGSAVSFYSGNKYVSKDLDLINVSFAKRRDIKTVMERMGFQEKGRFFVNPEIPFLIEFPQGPLSVGEEPVKAIDEFVLATGTLHIISATDCVKDRLCAYYFWNDQQGLAQAVLVSKSQNIDLKEIKRWSKAEGKEREFEFFKTKFSKSQNLK
jgi:hypothetical protein